jgi:hypothetical protein
MLSRLSFYFVFVSLFSTCLGEAQRASSDVVVSGASVNDPYSLTAMCGANGQVYRWTWGISSHLNSVMRVARDGSTVLFMLPQDAHPEFMAAGTDGPYILSAHFWKGEGRAYDLYQNDSGGNLLNENVVRTDSEITRMAALSSGRVVVTTVRGKDSEDRKYGGAILGADGQVVKTFALPLPPGGGGWTFVSQLVARGDAAYVMLHSNLGDKTAIATVSEAGRLAIKLISVPADTEQWRHNQWLFGAGVAVEAYHDPTERPHISIRFDEYDLATGEKIAAKKAAPGVGGYNIGCYYGNEVTWLAGSAHVDPARGLSPDALRLVTAEIR